MESKEWSLESKDWCLESKESDVANSFEQKDQASMVCGRCQCEQMMLESMVCIRRQQMTLAMRLWAAGPKVDVGPASVEAGSDP